MDNFSIMRLGSALNKIECCVALNSGHKTFRESSLPATDRHFQELHIWPLLLSISSDCYRAKIIYLSSDGYPDIVDI